MILHFITVSRFAPSLERLAVSSAWLQKGQLLSFSKLVHLTTLDLSWNWLHEVSWLSALTNLEQLDLHHAKFQGSIDLRRLVRLKSADLSENEISELFLPVGASLTNLNLSYNSLASYPANLFSLTALESLNLAFNRTLTTIPAELASLPRLSALNLTGILFKALPAEFGTFPRLEKLILQLTNLTTFPDVVFALTSLKELEFSNNKVTKLPKGFAALTLLEKLSLRFNDLSEIPDELFSLPRLTWLELCGNELRRLSPLLSNLKQLTYLDVSFNKIDELPEELASLESLTHLHICSNPLPASLIDLSLTTPNAGAVLSAISEIGMRDLATVVDTFAGPLPAPGAPKWGKPSSSSRAPFAGLSAFPYLTVTIRSAIWQFEAHVKCPARQDRRRAVWSRDWRRDGLVH